MSNTTHVSKWRPAIGFAFSMFIAVFAANLNGCNSKVLEPAPAPVSNNGISLETRLAEKTKVDNRLNEVQKASEKSKKILQMFRKIQDPKADQDVYTPIDFLIDANTELANKLPEKRGETLVRYAKIHLNINEFTEECRTVDTLLESSNIIDESNPNKPAIGERLTYFIKTCKSENQYIAAIEADWVGSAFEFRFINKNLRFIFADLIAGIDEATSSCKIIQSEQKTINSVHCQALTVKLSKSETAIIKDLTYDTKSEVRYQAIIDLYEVGKKKAVFEVKVLSNGEILRSKKEIDAGTTATKGS